MNKTLVITAIVLVAVVMGISAVAPAIATHSPTPLVRALDCFAVRLNFVCVAIDRDEDGVCDTDARSVMPASVADRLGILDKECGGK